MAETIPGELFICEAKEQRRFIMTLDRVCNASARPLPDGKGTPRMAQHHLACLFQIRHLMLEPTHRREQTHVQKIGPCLWFDGQAEEAAVFYVSIFKNSRIVKIARYLEGSPGPKGSVMTVQFILDRQEFLALNGAP
jgi:hypothetical protein